MIWSLLKTIRSRVSLLRFGGDLRSEAAETFVEALMAVLKVGVAVDPDLRESLSGFDARYRLTTRDEEVDVGIEFRDGHIDIDEDPDGPFDATMRFKDADAILGFFSSANPDLLGMVLEQKVVVEGNLNYVYRLAYMAKHLQLEATCRI